MVAQVNDSRNVRAGEGKQCVVNKLQEAQSALLRFCSSLNILCKMESGRILSSLNFSNSVSTGKIQEGKWYEHSIQQVQQLSVQHHP